VTEKGQKPQLQLPLGEMLGRSVSGGGVMLMKSWAARLGSAAARTPLSSQGAFASAKRCSLASLKPVKVNVDSNVLAQVRALVGTPAANPVLGGIATALQTRCMSTGSISAQDFPMEELLKQVEVVKVRWQPRVAPSIRCSRRAQENYHPWPCVRR
jgi:hypothetical protein